MFRRSFGDVRKRQMRACITVSALLRPGLAQPDVKIRAAFEESACGGKPQRVERPRANVALQAASRTRDTLGLAERGCINTRRARARISSLRAARAKRCSDAEAARSAGGACARMGGELVRQVAARLPFARRAREPRRKRLCGLRSKCRCSAQSAPELAGSPCSRRKQVGPFRVSLRKNPRPDRASSLRSAVETGEVEVFTEVDDQLSLGRRSELSHTSAGDTGHVAYPRARTECRGGRFVGVSRSRSFEISPPPLHFLVQPPRRGHTGAAIQSCRPQGAGRIRGFSYFFGTRCRADKSSERREAGGAIGSYRAAGGARLVALRASARAWAAASRSACAVCCARPLDFCLPWRRGECLMAWVKPRSDALLAAGLGIGYLASARDRQARVGFTRDEGFIRVGARLRRWWRPVGTARPQSPASRTLDGYWAINHGQSVAAQGDGSDFPIAGFPGLFARRAHRQLSFPAMLLSSLAVALHLYGVDARRARRKRWWRRCSLAFMPRVFFTPHRLASTAGLRAVANYG